MKSLRLSLLFVSIFCAFTAQSQKCIWTDFRLMYDTVSFLRGDYSFDIGLELTTSKNKKEYTQGWSKGKLAWDKFNVKVDPGSFYYGKVTRTSNEINPESSLTITITPVQCPTLTKTTVLDFRNTTQVIRRNGRAGVNQPLEKNPAVRMVGAGTDGNPGADGMNGENGPSLLIQIGMVYDEKVKDSLLKLTLIDSLQKNSDVYYVNRRAGVVIEVNGGNGADGTNGGSGSPGKERITSTNMDGGNGGAGGKGGNGGNGGKGGNVTLQFTDSNSKQYLHLITIINKGGKGGIGGKGGKGGPGGNGGVNGKTGLTGNKGTDGENGTDGANGSTTVLP